MSPVRKKRIRAGEFTNIRQVEKSVRKKSMGEVTRMKDEGMNVRFLTEPTGWKEFWEHYIDDGPDKGYLMCEEGGCDLDAVKEPSHRYLVNAINLDDNNKVIALVLAQTAAAQVLKKYKRFHTLLDRDYSITREGTGFDTEYDVTPEAPRRMALDRYKPLDLWAIIERMANPDEEEDDEEEEEETPRRVVKKRTLRESPSKTVRKAAPRVAVRKVVEPPPRRIAKKVTPAKRVAKRAR